MQERLTLHPIRGDLTEPIEVAATEPATIGRGGDCTICLADDAASRRHAVVHHRIGGWFVTDLGSRHGTILCGARVDANTPVILRDRDVLQIGSCMLRVAIEYGEEEPGAAPAPASVPDAYRTRPSIFLRLRDDRTEARELSWQEFRDRYAPVIVGFARNLGLPSTDADDVLQDVMLAFFQVTPRFEYDPARGRFRGYLKTIVRRAVAERARKRAAAPVGDIPDVADAETDTLWDRAWAEQLMERALAEARQRFDVKTIEAFELFGRRRVPAEDVAERLGMSVHGVHHARSRVQRAIAEIVERLGADEG